MTKRYSIVDVGGLIRPCVANYTKTIEAMKVVRGLTYGTTEEHDRDVAAAQMCRYENIELPLMFLGQYEIENPETGGLPIERLHEKYPRTIGLAICLSVLEHVDRPWRVAGDLAKACAPGALLVISVPWEFPTHGPPAFPDHFRFSQTGLRQLFIDDPHWEVLEAGMRLDVPADAGVLELHSGRPQAIQSAYLVARCK